MKSANLLILATFLLLIPIPYNIGNAGYSSYNTDDVEIYFQSGFGIQIVLNNPPTNEYTIHNFSLNKIDFSGMIVIGLSNGVDMVMDIEPGNYAILSFVIFGFGEIFVNAYISYEENHNIVTKDLHCKAMVIGPIVLVIDQW
ncbi:MAG: hypothetical protein J7K61_04660 [Thermoplasmata archaeon]|nr:hypothetical protein [Thermoplasmata archaeon]